MSEVTSVVEQEQQQQEYVGGSSNSKLRCKDCNVSFNSDKSLEVHLHYHKGNLLSKWTNQMQQQESNNNNSKAGNHNRQANVKQENVIVSVDLSEPSSTPSSQDPTSSQHQQQSQQQPVSNQAYNNFLTPISFPGETTYSLQNMSHVQNISMGTCHSFSPSHEDIQNNAASGSGSVSGAGYARFQPYPSQHYSSERGAASSASPQSSSFQCDKCGAAYDDANQLGEHVRVNHSDSPTAYQSAPQYHQLGSSPQQQDQSQQPPQQLHASPTHSNQPQQQSSYDYNGGHTVKLEMKQEPEEQTEILDLDSHKVQTRRYENEFLNFQQQQHEQELHIQMHHQQVIHQQQHRLGTVSSMLAWPPAAQSHDYHARLSGPMGHMDGLPIDQSQFIRSQHLSVVDPPVHQAASIITNTQPIPGHQMPTGMLQQPPKPPSIANQSWKSNEARRPKTYNCSACNKWFTSSGHLKRHYNTTLHKNAVKQSNLPDPANLPISAHHHPTRENNVGPSTSARGSGAPERSPDLTSSASPPNSMAGPSGEATGGLLHTPTTLYNSHSSNSNSSNSNDSSAVMALAQQQQQGPPSAVHLSSGIVPLSSPQQSPMAMHHQQQMVSPSLQQQQQQLHHLPMSSPGQLQVHHSTSSPISHMHPPLPASHMNSPSAMGSSSQHHVNLSSITSGTVHPAMVSPTTMADTTMPNQPYPNAMPPHVTSTISIPDPLESINTITIIGSDRNQQQRQQEDMLPSFGTFSSQQRPMSFLQLGLPGYLVDQHQQAVNVGGLSPEEMSPQGKSFGSPESNYELYSSPPRYELLNMDVAMMQTNTDGMIVKQLEVQNQQAFPSHQFQQSHEYLEHNNNLMQTKEDLNANINPKYQSRNSLQSSKGRKGKTGSAVLKEQQAASTNTVPNTPPNFISQDGFHKCLECDKLFNKACYLTQHNKSFHVGEKPFKCGTCGKRFFAENDHKNHLSKHAGDKPYKCVKCPKQFNHKTDLRRHTCLHTGEKPYTCTTCDKGFIRKDHMMKHFETHKKKSSNRQQKENVHASMPSCSVNM